MNNWPSGGGAGNTISGGGGGNRCRRVSVGWLVRQPRSERALKCAPQMSSPSLGAGCMKKTTANAVVAALSRGWVDRHDSTELSQAQFSRVFELQDKARAQFGAYSTQVKTHERIVQTQRKCTREAVPRSVFLVGTMYVLSLGGGSRKRE